MKRILFISASLLDTNLMKLACEGLPQKIRLIHLNIEAARSARKKAAFDLVIINHCDEFPQDLKDLTKNFQGTKAYFTENPGLLKEKNSFSKPFDEETLNRLLAKLLKRRKP